MFGSNPTNTDRIANRRKGGESPCRSASFTYISYCDTFTTQILIRSQRSEFAKLRNWPKNCRFAVVRVFDVVKPIATFLVRFQPGPRTATPIWNRCEHYPLNFLCLVLVNMDAWRFLNTRPAWVVFRFLGSIIEWVRIDFILKGFVSLPHSIAAVNTKGSVALISNNRICDSRIIWLSGCFCGNGVTTRFTMYSDRNTL